MVILIILAICVLLFLDVLQVPSLHSFDFSFQKWQCCSFTLPVIFRAPFFLAINFTDLSLRLIGFEILCLILHNSTCSPWATFITSLKFSQILTIYQCITNKLCQFVSLIILRLHSLFIFLAEHPPTAVLDGKFWCPNNP